MISPSLHRLGRAAATAAAAVGLAAFASLAPAQTPAPVKVRVSTIPIIDTAPLQVALAKGFFAAEGLDIDTTPTAGGASGLPALAAGQVQISFSNIISIVLGAKQGLGFEIIAAGSNTGEAPPDLAGMVTKTGSPLRTGKDFEGKRIAVNTRNNIIWLYARAWVQATGGNPDAVTYLEVPFPQMLDAVRGDRVDAAFIVEPFLSAGLKSQGVALIGWPYNTVQKNVPVAHYAATRTFIQQNPAVIERWVRAYNKGVDWANQNAGSDELNRIIAAYTRLQPEQIAAIKLVPYQKTVNPADIDIVVDLMRKHGMTEGAFDTKAILHKTATQGGR